MGRDIKPLAQPAAGKQGKYRELVAQRKKCHLCCGLTNPQHWPAFDGDEIGPWTRWQGNLDADLMIVGQDFGDRGMYEKQKGRDKPENPTNSNLIRLLSSVGITIPPNALQGAQGEVFLTNAVLCLKDPKPENDGKSLGQGMQAPVQGDWFSTCGATFLRSQVDLVNPKVLVCLGESVFNAVADLYRIPRAPSPYRRLVESQVGERLPGLQTKAVGLYHCGSQGVNRNRSMPEQLQDWVIVKQLLEAPF